MHSKPFERDAYMRRWFVHGNCSRDNGFWRLPPGQASRPHQIVLAAQAVGLEGGAATQKGVKMACWGLARKIHAGWM